MHSAKRRPSLSERRSELPCMPGWPWPLWRLQQLQLVLAPVLLLPVLLLGEQRGRPKQRRWVWQPRKGEMVATRFVGNVHANRGAGAHAGPRERREASVP